MEDAPAFEASISPPCHCGNRSAWIIYTDTGTYLKCPACGKETVETVSLVIAMDEWCELMGEEEWPYTI
jgi:hypothetical protein